MQRQGSQISFTRPNPRSSVAGVLEDDDDIGGSEMCFSQAELFEKFDPDLAQAASIDSTKSSARNN